MYVLHKPLELSYLLIKDNPNVLLFVECRAIKSIPGASQGPCPSHQKQTATSKCSPACLGKLSVQTHPCQAVKICITIMRYQHELIKAQKNKNIPKYRGESFHAIELVYTYHSLSSIDIFVYFGKRLVALRWLRGRQGVKTTN